MTTLPSASHVRFELLPDYLKGKAYHDSEIRKIVRRFRDGDIPIHKVFEMTCEYLITSQDKKASK